MAKEIKVGLLGAGTVGGGVILVLKENQAEITQRLGAPVKLYKVCDKFPEKAKELDPELVVTDKVEEVIADPEVDIVVELMGREHPAVEFIEQALRNGKNVVTANKDVIARHGSKLLRLAKENGVDLFFEAAVAGGIPIIRPMKSCLAANRFSSVMGILNGTTNYILTKMAAEHVDFAPVLKEAQKLGYAESDPTADIGGFDAARKLAILASIAFNMGISFDDVAVEGIEKITLEDILYADELGYVIKLVGMGKKLEGKGVCVRVQPMMLPKTHPLSQVNDVYNAVYVKGEPIGDLMFQGRGAGRMPTASAVCGDIIDCCRNIMHGSTGRVGSVLYEKKHLCAEEDIYAPCYLRLEVVDKPGVLAEVCAAFGEYGMSLNSVIQKNTMPNGRAELVVITYNSSEKALKQALEKLRSKPHVKGIKSVIRVEDSKLEN